MDSAQYDLVVIGSGPAGQKGAIAAAKRGKRVAIVERGAMVGGVCVHTGTIPSKTVREAVLYLTGFTQRTFYGRDYALKTRIGMQDLGFRMRNVIEREMEVVRLQLRRNGITMYDGEAQFADPHTIEVKSPTGEHVRLTSDYALIACGTRPARPENVAFDGQRIIDPDEIPSMKDVPRDAVVIGAGVIGVEYASILAALGVVVTLVDLKTQILSFADREMVEGLCYQLRRMRVTFRLGEKLVSLTNDPALNKAVVTLDSGKEIRAEVAIYSAGRMGNADRLNIEAAGLSCVDRGCLKINENFQTCMPHIYAAGDVVGFPALASTSMEQGRLAACHMFGMPAQHIPGLMPFGVYTIPELSMVGLNEEQLTAKKMPYEVGVARYAEIAKSQMLGDETGMLKLLFDPKTLKLHGVHVMGVRATEIVHLGQAVLSYGGTIEYFRDAVFNYPTLTEAYKIAALNGLNKL
jgi:NAD(P) transhydrogenase